LAVIVENDLIQESLNKNIQNMDNVKVFYSSQIKDFKQDFQTVEIKLGDNSSLTTKLLIGIKYFI
jgi:2-polyprenyl-6-methoxyphenol hydroxylase-like FAD-dependent oxidoreductase